MLKKISQSKSQIEVQPKPRRSVKVDRASSSAPPATADVGLGEEKDSFSRDEIVRELEADIILGRLAPGARIDERELAARFHVSRMPVRDAIGRLASVGLVDVRPRSGSYVTSMDASELIQLFEFMGDLESLCARYCALRMSFEERAELAALAEATQRAEDISIDDYLAANQSFHDAIYKGAKNRYLETAARQTRQRIGSYRNHTFGIPGRLKVSAAEHLAIAKAISEGEADLVQKLMQDHTNIKRDDFVPLLALVENRNRRGQ